MAKSFKVPCPSCEADVPAKVAQIGKKIDCPKCKYRFSVPDPDATEDDAEPTPKKKGKKKGSPMMLVGILLGVLANCSASVCLHLDVQFRRCLLLPPERWPHSTGDRLHR